jgi:hypothetical protein
MNGRKAVLLGAIILVLALPIVAQKKQTAVKVDYDKFKDVTCASVDLGNIVSFRALVASQQSVIMDAAYCSPGQTLEKPSHIQLRFRTHDDNWLSGAGGHVPTVIFLLDGTDRLPVSGIYEYVVDKVMGGIAQVTLQVTTDELLHITSAKSVEFQASGEAYKLNQTNLTKLKDLAQNGRQTNNRRRTY